MANVDLKHVDLQNFDLHDFDLKMNTAEVIPFRSHPKFSFDLKLEVFKKIIKERSNCVVEAR